MYHFLLSLFTLLVTLINTLIIVYFLHLVWQFELELPGEIYQPRIVTLGHVIIDLHKHKIRDLAYFIDHYFIFVPIYWLSILFSLDRSIGLVDERHRGKYIIRLLILLFFEPPSWLVEKLLDTADYPALFD